MDRHGDQPFGGKLMQWIYKPDSQQVLHIADNLRSDDLQELLLSYSCPAHDVVFESWSQSNIVRGMATDDGEPCGLCGVVGQRIWMLGTDRLTETRKGRWQLCVEGRKWVDSCLEELQAPLFNQVYSKNTESIRWLKYLGFTIDTPRPYGPSAALFCDFWRNF